MSALTSQHGKSALGRAGEPLHLETDADCQKVHSILIVRTTAQMELDTSYSQRAKKNLKFQSSPEIRLDLVL